MSNNIFQQESYAYHSYPMLDSRGYHTTPSGFKSREVIRQEYSEQSKKGAVSRVVEATVILVAGSFLFAGVVIGLAELPAVLGPVLGGVGRLATKIPSVLGVVGHFATNVGVKFWEMAKSTWHALVNFVLSPHKIEALKKTVECAVSFMEGVPPPTTPVEYQCAFIHELNKHAKSESE